MRVMCEGEMVMCEGGDVCGEVCEGEMVMCEGEMCVVRCVRVRL